MKKLVLLTLGLVGLSVVVHARPRQQRLGTKHPQTLEIRLTKPLEWKNGCLQVRFDRINQSTRPLFVDSNDLSIDFAAKLSSSTPEENGKEEWLNVYGSSDIILGFRTKPLPPGGSIHSEVCVSSSVDVRSDVYESWRPIPVRGSLRIRSWYYFSDPRRPKPGDRLFVTHMPSRPGMAQLLAPIPCSLETCGHGCTGPPLIVDSEEQWVPEIRPHDAEWDKHGHELNARLEKLYPCST